MPRRKMTEEEKAASRERKEQKRVEACFLAGLLRLRNMRHVPDPARFFKVGERVEIGNLDHVVVTEVLDGGRIYKVHVSHMQNDYGRIHDGSYKLRPTENDGYWLWVDVLPYRSNEVRTSASDFEKNTDIRISYQQREIRGLLSAYYDYGIDLDPSYQRGNVWSMEQEVALIDSVFNNVDIGKFTLIYRDHHPEKDGYEMLDGKQRLTALLKFYEDRLEYRGKKFSQLSKRDQNHFESYHLSWGEIKDLTEEQKYRFFLTLNTGGTPMDPKHIERVKKLWEAAKGGK